MAEIRIRNKQILISSTFDINNQLIENVAYPLSDTDAATKAYVDALKNVMDEPTGFPPPTETDKYACNISIVGNLFSITPTGTTFNYYIKGIEYTSTGNTIIISAVEGQHYIYFDDNIIKETTIFNNDLLSKFAYVSELYWDATNNVAIHTGSERHGMVMDWATHIYLHDTFGTQYASGLALSLKNPANGSGDVDADAQIETENGKIRDEDITHIIINNNPQILSPISYIPVYYRISTGLWRKDTATTFPVKSFIGGNNLLSWNEFTGSIWTQTEVDNNDYMNYHIFGTNDIYEPIISVQGQNIYQNVSSARIGANEEISNLVTEGLAFQEFTPIGTVIYQTSTNFSNTVHAKIISTDNGSDYVDWRFQELSPTTSPSSHSSLTNLGSDDHLQYLRTDGDRDVTGIMSYSTGFTFTSDDEIVSKVYVDTELESLNYSFNNQNMTVLSGVSSIYLSTNSTVTDVPISRIRVMLNALEVEVGNGITLSDCFFSDDGGSTAKTWTTVAQGDNLYWNGNNAPYQLESTDSMDFIYLTK